MERLHLGFSGSRALLPGVLFFHAESLLNAGPRPSLLLVVCSFPRILSSPFSFPLGSLHGLSLHSAGPAGFAHTPFSAVSSRFCLICPLSDQRALLFRNLYFTIEARGRSGFYRITDSLFDLLCRSSKLHLSPKADVKNLISYLVTKTRAINGTYHRFLGRHFPRFYALYTVFMKGKLK